MTPALTAFVVTTGEPSTAECLARVRAQDVPVRVEVVENVAPMWRAFQAMIDRCETPRYVQVDADMLLAPHAVRHLDDALTRAGDDVAIHVGWLWGDAEERPIQGVKVYRHEATRQAPYADALSCEMPQIEVLARLGWRTTCDPLPSGRAGCLGEHRAMQTPEMAFARWQRLMQKYRRFPYMAWLAPYPARLRDRAAADPSTVNLAAYHGALAGLAGPPPAETEDDFRAPRGDFRRYMTHLGDWAAGPKEVSLYVTDHCNFKCGWCRRQHGWAPSGGEMTGVLIEQILDTFPTIRAACVAGFGEPLLHHWLGELIAVMHRRNLYVGLITNGLLLADRAEELVTSGLSRVTVSLNAASAEEHRQTHGVDAWERVLAGIRRLVGSEMVVALSHVTTRRNVERLPALLALARDLGVNTVDLPNLLPHAGIESLEFRDAVITTRSTETLAALEAARAAPGADLVGHWPVPIDLDGPCPRRCESPFVSIGIDGHGSVTGCRRMLAPVEEHGQFGQPGAWHGLHFLGLRMAMTGDRPLPAMCGGCFGAWSR